MNRYSRSTFKESPIASANLASGSFSRTLDNETVLVDSLVRTPTRALKTNPERWVAFAWCGNSGYSIGSTVFMLGQKMVNGGLRARAIDVDSVSAVLVRSRISHLGARSRIDVPAVSSRIRLDESVGGFDTILDAE